MSDRQNVVDTYMDNYFFRMEGEQGVRNLETMCEHLGYGQCYMTGNAIVDMLQDNPGAVEAVANFLADWAVRNTEWNTALEQVLEDDRVEIEE
jgi:hypothetical protein